jgi:hypothetical protein
VANSDAILVLANAIIIFPIKLIHFYFIAVAECKMVKCFQMPFEHLFHANNHPLCAQFWCTTRGTMDTQWRVVADQTENSSR